MAVMANNVQLWPTSDTYFFASATHCRPLLTAYRPGSILTNFFFCIIISNVINVVTMSGVGNKSNNRKR